MYTYVNVCVSVVILAETGQHRNAGRCKHIQGSMAKKYTIAQKLAAEFIGVFFLVFTWCSVSMSGSALGALAVASTLMICVYSLGSVSGGHFNPAVHKVPVS